MKSTTFFILLVFSVVVASTIAYPSSGEKKLKKYAWADDLVKSLLVKMCEFVCDDSSLLNEKFIKDVKNKESKIVQEVIKTVLKYALNN